MDTLKAELVQAQTQQLESCGPRLVKFKLGALVKYGQILDGEQFKLQAGEGHEIVEEALQGLRGRLARSQLAVVSVDDYQRYLRANFQEAQDVAMLVKRLVGKIFYMPGLAGGFAWYLVTEDLGAQVKVEWRGWEDKPKPDSWLGRFSTCTRATVVELIATYEGKSKVLDAAFRRKKKAAPAKPKTLKVEVQSRRSPSNRMSVEKDLDQ